MGSLESDTAVFLRRVSAMETADGSLLYMTLDRRLCVILLVEPSFVLMGAIKLCKPCVSVLTWATLQLAQIVASNLHNFSPSIHYC